MEFFSCNHQKMGMFSNMSPDNFCNSLNRNALPVNVFVHYLKFCQQILICLKILQQKFCLRFCYQLLTGTFFFPSLPPPPNSAFEQRIYLKFFSSPVMWKKCHLVSWFMEQQILFRLVPDMLRYMTGYLMICTVPSRPSLLSPGGQYS